MLRSYRSGERRASARVVRAIVGATDGAEFFPAGEWGAV